MKRAALVLLLILLALYAHSKHQIELPKREEKVPILSEPEKLIKRAADIGRDARIAELLNGMTLEEKVGQLFFVHCTEPNMAETIQRYHPGGVLLFTQDYQDEDGEWLTEEAFVEKLRSYQETATLPLFIGSNEEGGTVTCASLNPNLFPTPLASPRELWNAGGMKRLSTDTLQYNIRLRELGVNVNFAPVADVSTDPRDFIYDRAFGQDANATAEYVAQVAKTMGEANVGCVLKHFPGYGNNTDMTLGAALDKRNMETFRTSDFLPFVAGIRADAPFVLMGNQIVECIDAGQSASLSHAAHELLRWDLRFNGVVLADELSMNIPAEHTALAALYAGNDMVLTDDLEVQLSEVLEAVKSGMFPAESIDAAVTRILRVKWQLGLLRETTLPLAPSN